MSLKQVAFRVLESKFRHPGAWPDTTPSHHSTWLHFTAGQTPRRSQEASLVLRLWWFQEMTSSVKWCPPFLLMEVRLGKSDSLRTSYLLKRCLPSTNKHSQVFHFTNYFRECAGVEWYTRGQDRIPGNTTPECLCPPVLPSLPGQRPSEKPPISAQGAQRLRPVGLFLSGHDGFSPG